MAVFVFYFTIYIYIYGWFGDDPSLPDFLRSGSAFLLFRSVGAISTMDRDIEAVHAGTRTFPCHSSPEVWISVKERLETGSQVGRGPLRTPIFAEIMRLDINSWGVGGRNCCLSATDALTKELVCT